MKTRQPNIIFILADDLGYGDVACYNPESKVPTPNLDKLASQGVSFADAMRTQLRAAVDSGRSRH